MKKKLKGRPRIPQMTKFETNYIPEPNTGCWLWTGLINNSGYGRVYIDGVNKPAHRLAYRLFNGSIPNDLTVDHRCNTPSCVNPQHLDLLSRSDNSKKAWLFKPKKTTCKWGHSLDNNVYVQVVEGKKHRHCKTCQKLRDRAKV